MMKHSLSLSLVILILAACSGTQAKKTASYGNQYASLFETGTDSEGHYVISVSPFDGARDTLRIDEPFNNIICMSTSYVAYLDEIGCDSVISAVSGLRYVSSPQLLSREVYDIGSDVNLDYERIITLQPDVLVTYCVSAVEPQYVAKLRSLGIRVFIISDQMENHPLARAEYVRLFGAMTGREAEADSVFTAVAERYNGLVTHSDKPAQVLMNIPYSDQWYIPGGDSYMSQLVRDAGGEILGAKAWETASSVISCEEAYVLSKDADLWLNPGYCSTKEQLKDQNPLFSKFNVDKIFNNIARMTTGGGNDFWETGAARPDLILEDLKGIFEGRDSLFNYYIEVK